MLEQAQALADPGVEQAAITRSLARLRTLQGDRALAEGRTAEAVDAYERAVALDPTAASSYAGFGLALGQLQQLERALAMLEQAQALAGSVEIARGSLGGVEGRRSRLDSAVILQPPQRRGSLIMTGSSGASLEVFRRGSGAAPWILLSNPAPLVGREALGHPRARLQVMWNHPLALLQTSRELLASLPNRSHPGAAQVLAAERGRELAVLALSVAPFGRVARWKPRQRAAGGTRLRDGSSAAALSAASPPLPVVQAEASTTVPAPPSGGGRLAQVVHSASRFDNDFFRLLREVSPKSLGELRQGFVSSGGYSLMDRWAKVSTFVLMIAYLPRALAIGLLAPFPRQWFDTKGSTGVMRTWSGVEMIMIYLLLPGILYGMCRVMMSRRAEGFLLLAFVVLLAVPVSLVVANLGTLFRLRLLFVLPLLLVAADGLADLGMRIQRMGGWVLARRRAQGPGDRAEVPIGDVVPSPGQSPAVLADLVERRREPA